MKKITLRGIIAAAAITLINFTGAFAQTNNVDHPTRLSAALSIGVPNRTWAI